MEQVMMKRLNVFKKGDLGVKGYEILFQDLVEETLRLNGFEELWWQALDHEDIFINIYSIYKRGDSPEFSIILSLQEYYNKIKEMTDKWIQDRLKEK